MHQGWKAPTEKELCDKVSPTDWNSQIVNSKMFEEKNVDKSNMSQPISSQTKHLGEYLVNKSSHFNSNHQTSVASSTSAASYNQQNLNVDDRCKQSVSFETNEIWNKDARSNLTDACEAVEIGNLDMNELREKISSGLLVVVRKDKLLANLASQQITENTREGSQKSSKDQTSNQNPASGDDVFNRNKSDKSFKTNPKSSQIYKVLFRTFTLSFLSIINFSHQLASIVMRKMNIGRSTRLIGILVLM